MVFKVVNKDTGEVVRDVRNPEEDGGAQFDMLPHGFRQPGGQPWHPELQVGDQPAAVYCSM